MFGELRPRKKEGLELLTKASELGNRKATAMIAWEMLFGVEVPQNITRAREIFEELAPEGVAEAHMVSNTNQRNLQNVLCTKMVNVCRASAGLGIFARNRYRC